MDTTLMLNAVSLVVFWVACFLVVYPYVIYPLLLVLVKRLRRSASSTEPTTAVRPTVTLVVSAYNEEAVIERKLENCAALDYPREHMRIIVVSDASDDRTDAIVEAQAASDSRISLHRQTERHGKTAGINAVMSRIDSDIVVFSDANALYEPQAITELVKHFIDPDVGYVVGSALYMDDPDSAAEDSEGLYWKYELWVKHLESSVHSVVGGDGAIYAIRRELFWPLKASDINDFVNPLQIIAKGFRGVFTRDARCFEYASSAFDKEFSRKRRIVNRAWRAVASTHDRFNLRQHGWFLFMLVSHKLIRWLSVAFIALACLAGLLIVSTGYAPFHALALCLILCTVLLAMLGRWLDASGRSMPRAVYLPYYFYFVGLASLLGIWDNYQGVTHTTWGHIRS